MPKIGFVRRSFRFDGGAEAAAASYIDILKKIGDLRIICESWSGDNAEVAVINVTKPKIGATRASRFKGFIEGVVEVTKQHPNMLIHSHELVPGANIIRLGDGLHSVWLKQRSMSRVWQWIDPFHRTKLKLEREALSHPNLKHVITISDQTKRSLVADYGLDPERITVIRNIVTQKYKDHDFARCHRLHNKMLYVGSGFWRKGLAHAIEAMQYLPGDWTLDVAGKDKQVNKYVKLAEKLRVLDRVKFLGAFPMGPEVYAQATVVIHPAIYDPFPNIAIESLSQGTPVVSTTGSGTADFDINQGVWTSQICSETLAANVLKAASVSDQDRIHFRDHVRQFDAEYLEISLRNIYRAI